MAILILYSLQMSFLEKFYIVLFIIALCCLSFLNKYITEFLFHKISNQVGLHAIFVNQKLCRDANKFFLILKQSTVVKNLLTLSPES